MYIARAVHVAPPGDPSRLSAWLAEERRGDMLVRLAVDALSSLERGIGPLSGAGIVVGHVLATLETNALFYANVRVKGARAAEPRRFPYTSPNAVSGECAVRFGLTGPAFAVGAGHHAAIEALAVARDLVSAGDAERIVVLAVDEIGAVAQQLGPLSEGLSSGAVAVLLTSDASGAAARLGDAEIVLGPAAPVVSAPPGHKALLPLLTFAEHENDLPICLSAGGARAFAKMLLMRV